MHEDGDDQWVTIANPWNVSLMESVDNGIEERMDGLQIGELDTGDPKDITLEPSGVPLRLAFFISISSHLTKRKKNSSDA